jgi:hypothetical protein
MFACLADGGTGTPACRRASIVFLITICTLFLVCLAGALVAASHAGTRPGGQSPHAGQAGASAAPR